MMGVANPLPREKLWATFFIQEGFLKKASAQNIQFKCFGLAIPERNIFLIGFQPKRIIDRKPPEFFQQLDNTSLVNFFFLDSLFNFGLAQAGNPLNKEWIQFFAGVSLGHSILQP